MKRYVRQLATLAFVSPRIIAAIVDGTAPADLTVTDLASLPRNFLKTTGATAQPKEARECDGLMRLPRSSKMRPVRRAAVPRRRTCRATALAASLALTRDTGARA